MKNPRRLARRAGVQAGGQKGRSPARGGQVKGRNFCPFANSAPQARLGRERFRNSSVKRKEKQKLSLVQSSTIEPRLFWVRKKNFFKKILLKILFFLTDDRYDFVDYYHKINGIEENRFGKRKIEKKLKVNPEPFFRYFKIYKNTLFILFVFLFFGLLLV